MCGLDQHYFDGVVKINGLYCSIGLWFLCIFAKSASKITKKILITIFLCVATFKHVSNLKTTNPKSALK